MEWTPIDWLGFAGGALLLYAFWRVSTKHWEVVSRRYAAVNLIACLLLLVYSWQKHAYINVVLNLIWGAIAARSMVIFRNRGVKRTKPKRK